MTITIPLVVAEMFAFGAGVFVAALSAYCGFMYLLSQHNERTGGW